MKNKCNNLCTSVDKDCTGCYACYNVCPVNAIKFIENSQGFKFPSIDYNKCIECGLCLKTCPINSIQLKNTTNPDCYAIMADDKIRYKSSSGGIFTILANHVLSQGGYVAGAVFDNNANVIHIVSNKIDDIEKMRGSKYLQSDIGKCFSEIKELLNNNKQILFTGTPCQVAGLKSYLVKDYENLFCIDILCHGVPSPAIFKKYISENIIKNKKNIKWLNTNFRDKIQGWNSNLITTTTTTTGTFSQEACNDDFMKAFLNNLCLRESCGNCRFNKIPRQGDCTIGDFWGINNHYPEYDDQKGTSVVLTNNSKGKSLLRKIEKQLKLIKKVPLSVAISGNLNFEHSTPHHHNRTYFFNNYKNENLASLNNFCLEDKCDFVIVNFWHTINYGAALTAYAMQELVNSFGLTCKILNRDLQSNYSKYYKGSFTENFANKYLNLTKIYDNNNLPELAKNIKGIILGSDQVLRLDGIVYNLYRYLLNWATPQNKLLAISPSFAQSIEEYINSNLLNYEIYKEISNSYNCFDYISCRETSGIEIFNKVFNLEADVILDPVFLIDKLKFEQLASNDSSKKEIRNSIVSYVLDDNEEYDNLYKYLSEKYECCIIKNNDKNQSVEEWLNSIKNCKIFITDSFHGVCFAIIFNKQFICVKNKYRGNERFNTLIELFNLSENFVDSISDIYEQDKIFEIDYTKVNLQINKHKKHCLELLEKIFLCNYSNVKSSTKNKIINYIKTKGNNFSKELEYKKDIFVKIRLLHNKKRIIKKYYRYKILSKILWGKKRKYYKNKKIQYHEIVREIRNFEKGDIL